MLGSRPTPKGDDGLVFAEEQRLGSAAGEDGGAQLFLQHRRRVKLDLSEPRPDWSPLEQRLGEAAVGRGGFR